MKKLIALMALVAMVAVSSVAMAQSDVAVTASIAAISEWDTTACDGGTTLIALTPASGAPDYDTANCNVTVTSNNAGWDIEMVETNGTPGALNTAYEAGMGHTQGTTGHPDVIGDVSDADIDTLTGNSEWGIWFDGALASDLEGCTSVDVACVSTDVGSEIAVVTDGAITAGTEILTFNVGINVDYEMTASTTYADSVDLTFTAA